MTTPIGSYLGAGLTNTQATGPSTATLQRRLATGAQINDAADNPAGLAILSQFAAQLVGTTQAASNLNSGISLNQVADSALGQLQGNTQQLQTLAVQAGDGALNAQDRRALQAQANQIAQANADIVRNTQFNGVQLFQGASFSFQAGAGAGDQITVATGDLSGQGGGGGLYSTSGQIDLTTQAGATQALGQIASDLGTLSAQRAQVGAASNGFAAAVQNLGTTGTNLAASASAIGSTDYASTVSNLVSAQIRGQAGIAVQAQGNASRGQVLSLLQGLG